MVTIMGHIIGLPKISHIFYLPTLSTIIIALRMQYLAHFLETCMVAGFHALGFNFIISFIGMLFIHSAQSYPTLEVRVLCS